MNKRLEFDYLFKIVLIGDSGIGKSCLLLRFADDSFTENFISTIGVDFRFRTLNVDERNIKLQIWDTAGQERFRTITSAYYRGADGIILVYDKTKRDTFDHVEEWLSEVEKFSDEHTVKFIIGNKSDMEEVVTAEEGEAKAEKLKVNFIETSAKTADNVDLAFTMMAQELIKIREQFGMPKTAEGPGLALGLPKEQQNSNSSNCC